MGVGRFYTVREHGELEQVPDVASALASRGGGSFLWIDWTDPTAEDLEQFIEPLGIHPLAIEDCLDADQIPKLDGFDGFSFLLVNRYRVEADAVAIDEVNLFLGSGFVLSVHSHGRPGDGLTERLETAVLRELPQARKGPEFLLHVLLDGIVDEKFAAIEALQDRLDDLEEGLLHSAATFQPARLIHLRRSLLALRKSLVYEREALTRICRRDSPWVSDEAIYGFRDIADHLAKFFEVVEICREMVGSILEIHLSLVNNRLTVAANKTNAVMRRLTMISTIFMPLTLLAGIGGMSEWSMMTGPDNWRLSYPLFLLGSAVIAAVNYGALRRYDRKDRPEDDPWGGA